MTVLNLGEFESLLMDENDEFGVLRDEVLGYDLIDGYEAKMIYAKHISGSVVKFSYRRYKYGKILRFSCVGEEVF